jgi:collagenase-like PrtC family protease
MTVAVERPLPARRPRLSLGPLLFNWGPERRRDFYLRIADEAPIDIVYLGEVVCSKRAPFFNPHLPAVAERLTRAGKEVWFSSLALVEQERERAALAELASDPELRIEANDLGAVGLLSGRPHAIGPFVNCYNEATLAWLAANGAVRVTLPAELSAATLATLAEVATGVELEVQAFGRMPLALSARCYHARAHGLAKDGCQFVCDRDPDGLEVATLEDEPFLAINGTMTMSHAILNLLAWLSAPAAKGIGCLRLWPHAIDMVAVARCFRETADGRREPREAERQLQTLAPFAPFCDGHMQGRPGAERHAIISPVPHCSPPLKGQGNRIRRGE